MATPVSSQLVSIPSTLEAKFLLFPFLNNMYDIESLSTLDILRGILNISHYCFKKNVLALKFKGILAKHLALSISFTNLVC